MLDAQEREELHQGMKVIRLAWAAMLLSLGVYLYVCHATAAQRPARNAADVLPATTTALFAAAAVALIVIRPVRRYLLAPDGPVPRQSPRRIARGAPSHPAAARYLAATVVTLALADPAPPAGDQAAGGGTVNFAPRASTISMIPRRSASCAARNAASSVSRT